MGTAMAADDFHALNVLQAAPMQDEALARTEGGAVCSAGGPVFSGVLNGQPGGGVSLCSSIGQNATFGGALFSVSNEAPVTGANFLGVIGGRAP
jgi:hypothetical protein